MEPDIKPKTIIIAKQGIGEYFISEPAIRWLTNHREVFGPILVYVCSQLMVDYIRRSDLADKVIPEVFPPRNILRACLGLRAKKPQYLLFMLSNGTLKHSLATMLIGAKVSFGSAYGTSALGFTKVTDMRLPRHKADLCWDIVRFVADDARSRGARMAGGEALPPVVPPARPDRHTKSGRIIFACGSGAVESHKRWPARSYAALAERLFQQDRDRRFQITLLGSKSELPLMQEVMSGVPAEYRERMQICIPGSIMESMEVLQTSELLVAGCTGTIHMGAVAGIRVLGIYGPTNPLFTGPVSDQVWIVRKDYRCSPCYRVGFITGCGNPRCLTDISVDDVFPVLLSALAGVRQAPLKWRATTNAVAPDPVTYDEVAAA